MSNFPEIALGKTFRIPDTYDVQIEGDITWLIRRIDKRRARVKWIEGETTYTAKELAAFLVQEGDHENPHLKDLLD